MLSLNLFKRLLCSLISLQIALVPTLAWPQSSKPTEAPVALTPQEEKQLRYDMQLAYWGTLDHEMPELAKIAFTPPEPTWTITGDNPLLDQDPFFMRTQSWQENPPNQECAEDICFSKDEQGLLLVMAGEAKALRLAQNFTPVLETSEHLFLSADDLTIFQSKVPGSADPGEGLFYIAKKDLLLSGPKGHPVPVFFFPLPGEGWTGKNEHAFEYVIADKVVFYNKAGMGMPIDGDDITLLEKVSRQNLLMAITYSFLDKEIAANGVALPKTNSTLAFGLILSGQRNEVRKTSQFSFDILPKAHAEEDSTDVRAKILAQIKARSEQIDEGEKIVKKEGKGYGWNYWKKWIWNGVLYGGTAAAAYALYEPVDFSSMVQDDVPERLATVAKIVGGVALASVVMKYSIHKAHFKKLYPPSEDDTLLRKLNNEHKGLMTELAHGNYFSLSVLPQGIRHTLEFLKDHFLPGNKMIRTAWEETMGYQMKTNSHLAMNYKTQYFGWLFGLADSILVGVFLLIFGPAAMSYFGLDVNMGHATAAYATSEVIRNFLGYFQGAGHNYSAEVKFIHMKSAQNTARSQLQAQGKDPDAPRNRQELQALTEEELGRRYKSMGLPSMTEFLYDPLLVLEKTTEIAGFSSPEATAAFPKTNFVLANRHWGMVQPALKRALQTAREAQKKSPSPTGARTIALLEWAAKDRSVVKRVADRVWDATASKWGGDGLRESINSEVANYISSVESPEQLSYFGSSMAYVKGAFKYLAVDSTKEVRDIREVLYLMSTTGNASEVMPLLPAVWREKAGSDEAAMAAAELFHRGFFSYYETNPQLIKPDALLEAEFGARAKIILEKAKDPLLQQDPFLYQVRYWELLNRLKMKDEARREIVNYQPKALSKLAAKQWGIVRAKAVAVWAETNKNETPPDWVDLAKRYRAVAGDEMKDASAWSKSYRYRAIVAREFARQVGIETEDVTESAFVQKVLLAAAVATDSELSTARERSYLSKLSSVDRQFYEAQMFSKHFVDMYINLSVHSDEYLKASSPEYPGILQKVRRKLVGKPGGAIVSSVLRTFETIFRNEETSYRPGLISMLERNVPLVPDMVHNFIRNLRIVPYFLLIAYPISWYVWQIHIPYALWIFSLLISFVNPTLVEVNNRFQRNHDMKPMGDVPSKLIFGWVHGMLTNPELLLIQGYSQPIVDGFDRYVVKPVKELPGDCVDLLRGTSKP